MSIYVYFSVRRKIIGKAKGIDRKSLTELAALNALKNICPNLHEKFCSGRYSPKLFEEPKECIQIKNTKQENKQTLKEKIITSGIEFNLKEKKIKDFTSPVLFNSFIQKYCKIQIKMLYKVPLSMSKESELTNKLSSQNHLFKSELLKNTNKNN